MPRTAILSFAITTAVLVPAAWRALDADLATDGKRLRPLQQSVEIDGIQVTLDVDRDLITTGDSVTATLVAHGPADRVIKVDLYALHATSAAGERVESPLAALARETHTLVAAPDGGTPLRTTFKLGSRTRKLATRDWFQVMVTKAGTKVPTREFDASERKQRDFAALLDEGGRAAGIGIEGWSGNNLTIALRAVDAVRADQPFTIAVTVTNTTKRTIEGGAGVFVRPQAELAERVVIDELDTAPTEPTLAPGATLTKRFRVTPSGTLPNRITLRADADVFDDRGAIFGALDVATFDVVDPAAAVASTK